MGEPYVKKDPGDIIRAQDWNDLQSQARDEIHGHLHTGGAQGMLLGGASIDPTTTMRVAKLEVTGDLLAKTRVLLDEIDQITARVTALEGKTRFASALSVTGLLTASGGIAMGDTDVRLRGGADPNHILAFRVDFGEIKGLNGPVLTGSAGGALGTISQSGGTTTYGVSLNWTNTSVTVRGDLSVTGRINAGGFVVMGDHDIRFRSAADSFHGVGFRTEIDGPLLWGNSGGRLGTANDVVALSWQNSGRVNVEASSLFFTKGDHPWDGSAAVGQATIQNSSDPVYNALMIVGRVTVGSGRRDVKLWDYLQVNGTLDVTGQFNVPHRQGWTTVGLSNGWVNYAGGWAPAAYMKDALGFVHLRGLIRSGTWSNAFVLPAGFRPGVNHLHCISTGGEGFGRIDVYPDGSVRPVNGNNGWMSLDGISFLGEL